MSSKILNRSGCHGGTTTRLEGKKRILLVGSPNVGKSLIFNRLTASYVSVSNYPGTTVDVFHGKTKLKTEEYEVVDTPGMYSLLPITEEERVARSILLEEKPHVVLNIVDAKNLERMLPLTLQLMEAALPVILVVNMLDEAERLGIEIKTEELEKKLGIPVVATVATTGRGFRQLREKIISYRPEVIKYELHYGQEIDSSLSRLTDLVDQNFGLSVKSISLLMLQEDDEIVHHLKVESNSRWEQIQATIIDLKNQIKDSPHITISMKRQQAVNDICARTFFTKKQGIKGFTLWFSKVTMYPITGIPILLAVLYFGLYKFVGEFGAGTVVDFLEGTVFEKNINPFINSLVTRYIPFPTIQELIALDYGIITLGVRYAIAIILPIVGTFFIAFSIIEDTGYLPRLAMLVDRAFKKIGLSGRAVIPMTLGFGCDTMATMVTRTLETTRERVIATMLLALAIPCSAQLGVILALMAQKPAALIVWIGFVLLVLVFIGYLSGKLMPGESPSFYMEVPPLRLPRLSNVFVKTYTRMQWYFMEVLPLFILASVLIWAGKITGLFDLLVQGLTIVVGWIGLPPESAVAFLFGFFRRDYGAAGLYDLQQQGVLSGNQLAVAAVTLTLFVPCIAQFLMMKKERGLKTALAMALFIFPFAFLMGGFLNLLLNILGIEL